MGELLAARDPPQGRQTDLVTAGYQVAKQDEPTLAELGLLKRENQLGRRNLPPEVMSVLRGRIYNRQKKPEHDGGKGKERSGGQDVHHLKTAETLALQFGVNEKTIRRDGKLAAEVEADPELKAAMNDRQELARKR